MTLTFQRRRTEPRAMPVQAAPSTTARLAVDLLREGLVQPDDMVRAMALQSLGRGRLIDLLLAREGPRVTPLIDRVGQHWGLPVVDPIAEPPDPRLIDRLGAAACLRDGLLPWRTTGGTTVIATARADDVDRHRPRLQALFGPVTFALAQAGAIETAVLAARGAALDRAARTRVALAESCRGWGVDRLPARFGAVVILILVLCALLPGVIGFALALWAILTLAVATGLKCAAALAALRRPAPEAPPPVIARLPVVSVMVALYREADIAARLIRRLDRLDYPRDLLDIVLVVEEDDRLTRKALADADLPHWMRVVVVPDGPLRTKPRALNHALDLCRGSIIGVYDAEDAPAPDQIRRVVDRFHRRDGRVACLQGVLDFYNPRTNWLSRCFTIEYATWFRIILPGLERLGFAIPLGGTTLFFRRDALESLGGWDAHNVTEDADLGMRLARHGYRTELIDSVTEEEANCRVLPWIRQRSRWLKGYMMTYAVHMRDPRLLWRQLGAWKFFGFQAFFLTTLSQFLLAPVLWTFWLVPLGLTHPVTAALPEAARLGMVAIFLATEAVLLTVSLVAMRMTPNRMNPVWALALHVYFPLGSLASYKAAWELVTRPFWWDKTSHGHFDAPPAD